MPSKIAVLQMCSTEDVGYNWSVFERLATVAVSEGATVLCTPENTFYLGSQFHKIALAERLDGPLMARCAGFAKEHQVYLFLGSMAELDVLDNGDFNRQRCYNTSVVFAPNGERIASYRKIHLFDVDIPNGMRIAESDRVIAGDTPVVVDTDFGSVGLSICYDLRFPELYRQLQEQGATMMMVPSAFTKLTGEAHWHTLLKARAIETQSWVIAPAQTGVHDQAKQRQSFGHSLIIDPWGRVIADAGTEPTVIYATIDSEMVKQVREAIPVQSHRVL